VYPFLERNLAPRCEHCVFAKECDAWEEQGSCRYLTGYMDRLEDEIMALEHIRPEDVIVVRRLVRAAGAAELIEAYVQRRGMFVERRGTVQVQGIVEKALVSQVNIMLKCGEQLGLSPKARAGLKLAEGRGPRAAIVAAMVELEGGGGRRGGDGEEAIDGEFTLFGDSEDGDGGGDGEDGGEAATADRMDRMMADGQDNGGG
jgi:hypothetical protein